ncbi:MAG: SEC-C domain-containing protein [Candidatus Wallbacteria bacterium]|nr:SEC-C domain-containing protein [Candidatus Wallbacteria bacterium]
MLSFSLLMPDVAASETRLLRILEGGGVPRGDYAFDEFFCVERNCDCKRVILSVALPAGGKPVATISHALAPDALGAGIADPTCLEPFGQQSEYASAMLQAFRELVLTPEYEERLRRHYRLVKDALADRRHPIHAVIDTYAPTARTERPGTPDADVEVPTRRPVTAGRNDPCPCESGKKFKRCCLDTTDDQEAPPAESASPHGEPPVAWEVDVELPPAQVPKKGTVETHADVPPGLRRRLERARIESLVLFRSMDHIGLDLAGLPEQFRELMTLDADCAEALWGLDQPLGKLSVGPMLRDTLRSLARLPELRARFLKALRGSTVRELLEVRKDVEPTVLAEEAYNGVKRLDPQAGR